MKTAQPSARDICEKMLVLTGAALKTGDFELFARCFTYPQELQTFVGRRSLLNENDLRDVFGAVRTFYLKNGVTDLSRRCVEAAFKTPDTIQTVYETRLLSGTTIIREAFPVFSTLVRIDDEWKIAGTSYALPNSVKADDDFLSRLTPKTREALVSNSAKSQEETPAKHLDGGPD